MPNKRFKTISLFSGAMGLDIGLERTGAFDLLAAVEKEPVFCETIRQNCAAGRVGNKKLWVYEGDITGFDPKRVMKDVGVSPGELDLLVGGPPCQSFSTAGKRGTVSDPRGTLIWQFLRFVEIMRPRFFLMENVRGLLSAALKQRPVKMRPDRGGPPLEDDELPGSVVRRFAADFEKIGYRFDCFEVNAVNYGAPQIRERALFIGNRFGEVVDFPMPTHGVGDEQIAQTKLLASGITMFQPRRTLRNAIGDLREVNPVILDFSPRKKRFLSLIPQGGNWRSLPEELQKESMGKAWKAKGGRSGWWRRLNFDLPSPTVVTMPNHASTALCHPTEVRALTLRECARIQEFPDAWQFCGTAQQQYAQVGNAVPTRLGHVAGQTLVGLLQKHVSKKGEAISPLAPSRVIYLQSHIRTRQWFKSGQAVIWKDGKENHQMAPKTVRAERALASYAR
ncbi:DNA cytosine methyltransferase [Patescibacteria group bacterium]|nr:MAG: DNA cytosine methyltransferase [Patescibacteria group bacterium]